MNADTTYVRNRVSELLSRLLGKESAAVPAVPGSALDRLTNTCALSASECDLLVLLAGLAIDASIAPELGIGACCHGNATLAQLADRIPEAQWSALAPTAPLRRWHLVELSSERIFDGSARIDERTLLGILGVFTLDPLLDALADPVSLVDATAESPHRLAAVEQVLDVWRGWDGNGSVPVVLVSGADATATAVHAARDAGFQALVLRAANLPTGPREQAEVAALLERESALGAVAAILAVSDVAAEPAAWNVGRRCHVPLIIAAPPAVSSIVENLPGRAIVHVELPTATVAERAGVWRRELGTSLAAQYDGATEVVAHRFVLGEAQIQSAAAEVRGAALESLAGYKKYMMGDIVNGPRSAEVNEWATRQSYIAFGTLMLAAAVMGVDACPIEGMVPAKVDEILGLEAQGLGSVAACALGYRSADDKYATLPKVRFPVETLVEYR